MRKPGGQRSALKYGDACSPLFDDSKTYELYASQGLFVHFHVPYERIDSLVLNYSKAYLVSMYYWYEERVGGGDAI